MIRVRDLRKTYPTRFGEKLVLDGISFDLSPGEKLGILGRNGAGKSTMVRLISGAEKPTSGTIERQMSVSWPLAFGGAFQHQLTGIDNLRFITRIYDQDFESNLSFVEEFAELGPYLREPVSTYSSGMRARLAFAISMIIEFDCFLIDEVGAVGDARFHQRCNYELFEKRADRAMIIISHDSGYLRDHCNRFAVLNDAKLRLFGDFDDAYADFRAAIGLDGDRQPRLIEWPANRTDLIETTHTVAVLDDAFRAAVQQGDWHRDVQEWQAAEKSYSEALAIYPYQRSYWVQKGHAAKEAGADVRAEIAYRTAIALGENPADVREHLEFVMARQGVSKEEFPIRLYSGGEASASAPAYPDIAMLASAVQVEAQIDDSRALDLLRSCDTCDDMLAALLHELRGGDCVDASTELASLLPNLLALSHQHLDAKDKQSLAAEMEALSAGASTPLQFLIERGGFAGWQSAATVLEPAQ